MGLHLLREVSHFNRIRDLVYRDLCCALSFMSGETLKELNDRDGVQDIIKGKYYALFKGTIPKSWSCLFAYPLHWNIVEWFDHLLKKFVQVNALCQSLSVMTDGLWLGGLFLAKAFLSSFKQSASKSLMMSLKDIGFVFTLGKLSEPRSLLVNRVSMIGLEANNESFLPNQESREAVSLSLACVVFDKRYQTVPVCKFVFYIF